MCRPCEKVFNSEQQWKAHKGGKKHKHNCKNEENYNNNDSIDVDIRKDEENREYLFLKPSTKL